MCGFTTLALIEWKTEKSLSRSFLIHYLQSSFEHQDIGIAYIYCDYNKTERQTPVNLIADLLRQLVIELSLTKAKSESIQARLKALYESSIVQNLRPTVNECTGLLREVIKCFPKVFVVIDALDECPEAREVRYTLLKEIKTLQPQVGLLITSRYIPNIAWHLQKATQLEVKASNQDIKNYLVERLHELRNTDCLLRKEIGLHDIIVKIILEKASGMLVFPADPFE